MDLLRLVAVVLFVLAALVGWRIVTSDSDFFLWEGLTAAGLACLAAAPWIAEWNPHRRN